MEEDEDILIERDFRFDPPFFYEKGKPFFPIVCRNPDRVSEGFNATTLYLDGRLSSTLDWKIQKQAAAKAIENGLKLFWELYLGLNQISIDDEMAIRSIQLSLDHFLAEILDSFADHTIGVVVASNLALQDILLLKEVT